MKARIVGLAAAALLCVAVTPVVADPIAVTSGNVIVEFGENATVTFTSGAFMLSLLGSADAVHMPGAFPPPIVNPGDAIDLSATLNGTFQENRPGGALVPLSLSFSADPLRAVSSLRLNATVRTPFTMTGTVAGNRVAGAGTVTVVWDDSAHFAFSPASTPTPEPASLLLLGTGVIGLLVRRFTVV